MTALTEVALDPGIRRWISRIAELAPSLPGLESTDPAVRRIAARRLSDLVAEDFTLPAPEGIDIRELTIPGPAGELRMRRYRPAGVEDPLPTQLWLHGGGFFAGTVAEVLNDRLCARRTQDSGVQHFSLEYRLAPEHPYPAAVDDALAALRALRAEPALFGVAADRLGLGGNSAGALIALSTALHLRDAGDDLVHLALEVPPASLTPTGASAHDYAVGFGLDDIGHLAAMYVGPAGPADPYISPLDVPDLTGLPSTLILVAEFDPLRDSGIALADRLREAGVPADLYCGAGHLHASCGQTAAVPAARAWQDEHSRRLAAAYRSRT